MATIIESTTDTVSNLNPGGSYVIGIAGTWDGMTATLKWSDGTNDVAFPSAGFTSDAGLQFVTPTDVVKVVTGADSTNAGSLTYSIAEVLDGKKNGASGFYVK